MKLGIIGSREFNDYKLARKTFVDLFCDENGHDITKIVSGGAQGADRIGEIIAADFGIETKIFYPDWNKYGKSAGFLRNKDIINESDWVLAFWNGSNGTKHSLGLAKAQKKPTIIIYF